jgi:hypothetical protein
MLPTRVTQRIQVIVQNRVIGRVLHGGERPITPPWIVRLIGRTPRLQRLIARLIGIGVRPEHVRTPVART